MLVMLYSHVVTNFLSLFSENIYKEEQSNVCKSSDSKYLIDINNELKLKKAQKQQQWHISIVDNNNKCHLKCCLAEKRKNVFSQ